MATIEYIDVRKGMVLVGDNDELYKVLDRDLNTPGNWRAILNIKVKSYRTGSITSQRVRPQDKVELAYLEKRNMQYLYKESNGYVFMDNETFEQITLSKDFIDDQILYLKENDAVQVIVFNEKPIDIELPQVVELEVTEADPAIKGATAAAQTKPATLETGLIVQVPPFISPGDVIQVNTQTGEYLSRAKQ